MIRIDHKAPTCWGLCFYHGYLSYPHQQHVQKGATPEIPVRPGHPFHLIDRQSLLTHPGPQYAGNDRSAVCDVLSF
jgi:hypothetical protein